MNYRSVCKREEKHLIKTRSGIVRCVAAHSSFLRISSAVTGYLRSAVLFEKK